MSFLMVMAHDAETGAINRLHFPAPETGANICCWQSICVHQLTKYIVDSLAISESHTATNRHIASINYV